MTHKIVITPSFDSKKAPRHNRRGPLFDVSYKGTTIVVGSPEPCLDGARVLKAMGLKGRLELWDDLVPYVRLIADIDSAARVTVREGDEPPRLVKFAPFAPCIAQDGDCAIKGIGGSPNKRKPPWRIPRTFSENSGRGY